MKLAQKALTTVAAMSVAAAIPMSMTAQEANAITTKCAIASSKTVGGLNLSRLNIRTVCQNVLKGNSIGGETYPDKEITYIRYSEASTTYANIRKGALHEHVHTLEYHTTALERQRMYKYLGISIGPSKYNYFDIKDTYGTNYTLAQWKADPRERLAESVVNCTYGSPNWTGMKLVPRAQCGAFLKEVYRAASVAR